VQAKFTEGTPSRLAAGPSAPESVDSLSSTLSYIEQSANIPVARDLADLTFMYLWY
jgi:hypothetical protein